MEDENKEKLNAEFFSEYKNLIVDYVEERMELAQLGAVEKSAVLTGRLVFAFIAISFVLFTLFFVNIWFALFLGDIIQSRALGFLSVAGFYLFLLVLTLIFKKQIERPIMNMVVKQLMGKTTQE